MNMERVDEREVEEVVKKAEEAFKGIRLYYG